LELTPSPVQIEAERLGLPVHCPASLRSAEAAALFATHKADLAVIVAYGLILPPAILSLPRFGCVNLHASLLPRWRGAAPIQRALMAGDEQTGVMVMQMEEGLDTGPVGATARLAIDPVMRADEAHDQLASIGAVLMVQALDDMQAGCLVFRPQAEAGLVYARKIDKSECRIDWFMTCADLHNHIRGLAPSPGAFFEAADTTTGRVKVLRTEPVPTMGGAPGTVLDERLTIACGQGAVRLLEVQRAGRGPVTGEAFMAGMRWSPGQRV
jgi:methionyl-tRNA formyltransferase